MESTDFLRVLRAFRDGQLRPNMLAAECFMHCSSGEKSMPELEALTGSSNGRLSEALRTITPRWCSTREELRVPALYLLDRRKEKGSRAYKFTLSKQGRQLLEGI